MSIKTVSATSWERIFPAGDRNDSHDIVATAEGLEIDYDTLAWEDIDRARAALRQTEARHALDCGLSCGLDKCDCGVKTS